MSTRSRTGRRIRTAAVLAAIASASAATALILARRNLLAVRVRGSSMEPTFSDGELVIVVRNPRQVSRGDIIVFHEPQHRPEGAPPPPLSLVVKRVAVTAGEFPPEQLWARLGRDSLVPDGCVAVLSDNPAGVDSRTWGYISNGAIVGSVVPRRRTSRSA